jgi:hypothetical protein
MFGVRRSGVGLDLDVPILFFKSLSAALHSAVAQMFAEVRSEIRDPLTHAQADEHLHGHRGLIERTLFHTGIHPSVGSLRVQVGCLARTADLLHLTCLLHEQQCCLLGLP